MRFAFRLLAALAVGLVGCSAPERHDGGASSREMQEFVRRFYSSVRSPDASGFLSLWSGGRTTYGAARLRRLRTLLPERTLRVRVCDVVASGDQLHILTEPDVGNNREGDRQNCHSLVAVREGGSLKVVDETSPWEPVAARIVDNPETELSETPLAPELARAFVAIGQARDVEGASAIAIRSYDLAREVGRRLGSKSLEVLALLNRGYIESSLANHEKAHADLTQCLNMARELADDPLIGRCLMNLGRLQYLQSDYSGALRHYDESLAIAKRLNSEFDLAYIALNLGALQGDISDYRAAADNLRAAVAFARKAADPRVEAGALNNLGGVYHDLGKFDEAFETGRQSLQLKDATGDTVGGARTLFNMGATRAEQGRYSEAMALFRDSYQRLRARQEITDR